MGSSPVYAGAAVTTWRIRWSGWLDWPAPAQYPQFEVYGDGRIPPVLVFSLGLNGEQVDTLQQRLRNMPGNLTDRIQVALLGLNVRRLEDLLRSEPLGDSGERKQLFSDCSLEDMSLLEAEARSDKRCDYQELLSRGLVCSAASPNDMTQIATERMTIYAPTNIALCNRCRMPDISVVCSHLTWPQVTGSFGPLDNVITRDLVSAVCVLGQSEVRDPGQCRCGGHSCWERVAKEEDPTQHRAVGALSLHHALDYLDLSWRAWRGKSQHLLHHRAAEYLGGLALDCASRAEFGQRLNELDSVLKSMTVPAHPNKPVDEKAGSLVRTRSLHHSGTRSYRRPGRYRPRGRRNRPLTAHRGCPHCA